MKKLVIVESPTKAKTIRGFLPKEYHVEASMGHIRDLPSSAAEVPEAHKDKPWSRLGVNVEKNFEPLYVVPSEKRKVVAQLRKELSECDELFLATDEDREGESIGWHLLEALKPKVPVRRMVFHEITREAIQQALKETRQIDVDLVHAQETRRILDRLVGYTVSPLLWRKIAPKLSAGRVQSVAVRLLVLRERERRAFRSGTYWDLKALLNKRPDLPAHRFEAFLLSVGGVRVASGRDFDESTGKIAANAKVLLLDQKQAEALRTRLLKGQWKVSDLEEKESSRSPYPPFTTSTLQQEANRKLGMGAKETMRTAQTLYENGYITYMRTDSVNLSDQAIEAARRRVRELYGESYLTDKPRHYHTKTKNAQEAHEAIRPAGDQMRPVDQLPIADKEARLYDLIWKRTVASQMANARLKLTTATIAVEDALFRATGRTVLFPGFLRAYVEGSDDPEAALDDQNTPLPPLSINEGVDCRGLDAQSHETKPPARYTEATLVKALESEGIGRPSTYASIIDTVQERGYVFKQRKELVPTFTAFAVTQLMENHFTDLVDLSFTANMEQKLDDIATGEAEYLAYLRQFFLGETGLENQVKGKDTQIDPRLASNVEFSDLGAEIRIGQFGPFIAREVNGERQTASIPGDLPPADLDEAMMLQLLTRKVDGPKVVGIDPESGQKIYLKAGPFGPYVELGSELGGDAAEKPAELPATRSAEPAKAKGKGKAAKGAEKPAKKKAAKPKRASLLKGMNPDELDLAMALKLLTLPRMLGQHPETGKPIQAGVGRFGPYVVYDGKFTSLRKGDDVLEVGLERALELINGAGRGKTGDGAAGGSKGGKSVLKELGDHPDGGKVQVLDGRYGPYVNYKKVNATLPKEMKPEDVTMAMAIKMIVEKETKKK